MSLIDPKMLAARLSDTVVLDASWHMPDTGRDAHAEFLAAHIPGAQRFDIDEIADPKSALPHTLPAPETFAEMVGALGIGNDTKVVVYEAGAPFAAPRAWWMFRVMGHPVDVLDGGLARWRAEGFDVESGAPRTVTPQRFEAHFDRSQFADARDVADAIVHGGQVVDARSAERFSGAVPEPRPQVRSGHMPGARNVPYAKLVDEDGRLAEPAALAAAFEEAGVDLAKPTITTCGSGVTAAILTLALDKLGTRSAVYDGSWTEWGSDPNRPVATK